MTSSISIRTLARRTFSIYTGNASVLLPAAGVTVVVLAGLGARPAKSSTVLAIGAFVVSVLALALFTGTVVKLAADAWEEKPAASTRELLADARAALGKLILVGLVAIVAISCFYTVAWLLFIALAFSAIAGVGANAMAIIVIAIVGFVLLLAPGTYLLTVWSVTVPVVVLERPGGLRALTRSNALVRGHRWKVLGLIVLFWIAFGIGGRVLDLASRAAGHDPGVAIQLVAWTLIAPIALLGVTALYFELRGATATTPLGTPATPYTAATDTPPPDPSPA
ncbi:MAG: hypothetical protein ACRDK7_13900 [Solirubrobacteraceae bacterium]